MPWFVIAAVALIVLSTLATIANIGKPRDPITPGVAVFVLIANALLIWAIVEGVTA